jgi:adenylate cyclase class IV
MLTKWVDIARARELEIDWKSGGPKRTKGKVVRWTLPTRHFSSSNLPSNPPRNLEIEAKFFFTQADEERIAKHSEVKLVKTKKFTDIYFDSPSRGFPLTTRDIWLRQRSGNWEVKIPIGYYTHNWTSFGSRRGGQSRGEDESATNATNTSNDSPRSTNTDSYVEIEVETDILRFLYDRKLLNDVRPLLAGGEGQTLEVSLRADGFEPCATITTHRSSYLHGDVGIDLDYAEPLDYRVGELEVMMTSGDSQDSRQNALHKIQTIAHCHQLDIANGMRGKVLEHLRVFSPKHYQALDDCGLLKSKGIKKEA